MFKNKSSNHVDEAERKRNIMLELTGPPPANSAMIEPDKTAEKLAGGFASKVGEADG